MHALQLYFEHQPDSHRIAVLTISVIVFWNIENALALDMNYRKWRHALTNSYFMLVDAPVQFVLGVMLAFTTGWVALHQFGLIYWLPLPNTFTQFVVSFVLLDLLEYVYHRFMHKFTPLWMVHLVHHSDRNMDSSTVLREHPLETGFRLFLLVIWVFVTGAGLWMVLARQFLQVISNVFAHSNFRLSDNVDRIVGLVFVTPNMHHVHHHYQQPYTDTNYGDVLSVWDRLFGTFSRLPAAEVVFGVDTHMDLRENADLRQLLVMPFGEHRFPNSAFGEHRPPLVAQKPAPDFEGYEAMARNGSLQLAK